MKNNIQPISDSYLCSACGACNAICAKEAISLKFSNIGRKYSQVDIVKCTECGLCQKVCPSIDRLELHKRYEDPFVGNILNTYIGHANDESIYKNAQSGGLCSSILCYLFDTGKIDGAIVCKMSYGDTPTVEGILAESREQVLECQKSCYTPVDVLSALKQAKDKKSLAVVGLPCHIEGAVHLAETSKRFSNIKYKIGLICDRTLCAGIMDVICAPFGNTPKKVMWRNKNADGFNYTNSPITVLLSDGNISVVPKVKRIALKDMFTAPRCRVCYDKLNVHADLVLGDPWGMSDYDKKNGDSVILIRTELGNQLLSDMANSEFVNVIKGRTVEVIKGQHIDDRKKNVRKNKSCLQSFIVASDTYLKSSEGMVADGLNNGIVTFIEDEKKDKIFIHDKANGLVMRYRGPSKFKRILNKIKNKIRNL